MKTICVGGDSSNSGKTALVVMLAKMFPGWAVVKVTPSRPDAVCPHGSDCGACKAPDGPYEIIRDLEVLMSAGKDTARFLDIGVEKVLWVRTRPEHLTSALDGAIAELADAPGVIVESTTGISFLNGLNILVTQNRLEKMKKSARDCLDRVDIVALNVDPEDCLPDYQDLSKLKSMLNPRTRLISMCAMLPPDSLINRDFVDTCQKAVCSTN